MQETTLEKERKSIGLSRGSLAGAATGAVLPFTMQPQQQVEWCWAAVTASVAGYYQQPRWTQCGVVNATRGISGCCQTGSSASCNQPWYLDQSLTKIGDLAQMVGQYLPWSQLTSEIDAGRPVGLRIGWSGGGGHFIAVDGYSASGIVDVQDPWYGHSSVDYRTAVTAYMGSGSWTDSYLTTSASYQPPMPQNNGSVGSSNDPWQPNNGSTGSTGSTNSDPWQPHS
jgi:hypothetical protein